MFLRALRSQDQVQLRKNLIKHKLTRIATSSSLISVEVLHAKQLQIQQQKFPLLDQSGKKKKKGGGGRHTWYKIGTQEIFLYKLSF